MNQQKLMAFIALCPKSCLGGLDALCSMLQNLVRGGMNYEL